jgi:hypothetical protein
MVGDLPGDGGWEKDPWHLSERGQWPGLHRRIERVKLNARGVQDSQEGECHT